MERYSKVTLYVFLNKKTFDYKKSFIHDRFFVPNRNFTNKFIEVVENSRFLRFFVRNSKLFFA